MTTMRLSRPMPDPLVELLAERLRVLGQPVRLRLIVRLAWLGEANVQTLADELVATQQNISKHLGALWRAGIVKRYQSGRTTVYSLANPATFAVIEQIATDLAVELQQSTTGDHPGM